MLISPLEQKLMFMSHPTTMKAVNLLRKDESCESPEGVEYEEDEIAALTPIPANQPTRSDHIHLREVDNSGRDDICTIIIRAPNSSTLEVPSASTDNTIAQPVVEMHVKKDGLVQPKYQSLMSPNNINLPNINGDINSATGNTPTRLTNPTTPSYLYYSDGTSNSSKAVSDVISGVTVDHQKRGRTDENTSMENGNIHTHTGMTDGVNIGQDSASVPPMKKLKQETI